MTHSFTQTAHRLHTRHDSGNPANAQEFTRSSESPLFAKAMMASLTVVVLFEMVRDMEVGEVRNAARAVHATLVLRRVPTPAEPIDPLWADCAALTRYRETPSSPIRERKEVRQNSRRSARPQVSGTRNP